MIIPLSIFHVGLLLVFKTDRNEACNGFTDSSVSVIIVNTRCRISAPFLRFHISFVVIDTIRFLCFFIKIIIHFDILHLVL